MSEPNEILIELDARCVREKSNRFNVKIIDHRECDKVKDAGKIGICQHTFEFYPSGLVSLSAHHLLRIAAHCLRETKAYREQLEHRGRTNAAQR